MCSGNYFLTSPFQEVVSHRWKDLGKMVQGEETQYGDTVMTLAPSDVE